MKTDFLKYTLEDDILLIRLRFPDGVYCLNCASKNQPGKRINYARKPDQNHSKGWFYCQNCKHTFQANTHTFLEYTQRCLAYWVFLFENKYQIWFKVVLASGKVKAERLIKDMHLINSIDSGSDFDLINKIRNDSYFNEHMRWKEDRAAFMIKLRK